MTFWDTIQRGEYVMFALALLCIAIICIWWVKAALLSKQKRSRHIMMQRVVDHVTEGDVENARQLCQTYPTSSSRIVCTGLKNIGKPITEVKASMAEVVEIEKEKTSRGWGWLKAIAVISPLLGLGGTLTGIIDRLRDLGEQSINVDTAAVCEALAPTLVTTVAGLGVGIFAIVAMTCLEGSIKAAKRDLDEVAFEFVEFLNAPS